ncbi:MAG: hypothetical protein LBT84_06825, partial [Spirochaetia bacterium]|nr:hypothetical protein [Spirochaetia bacterium]
INTGHAKTLLSAADDNLRNRLYETIIEKGLSVRALEEMLKETKTPGAAKEEGSANSAKQKSKSAHIKKMEETLRNHLGTKVEIKHSGKGGKIEISYYSLDDFERIAEQISK